MTSWGNGPWGITPWGGGTVPGPTPTPIIPSVQTTDIIGKNLISVVYSIPMKNGVAMINTNNYAITSNGNLVEIIGVLTNPESPAIQTVYLQTTPLEIGVTYTITVSNQFDVAGTLLVSPNNTGTFVGRITKQDFIRSGQTKLYNKEDTSVVGSIITALAISDDKIGGNQEE